MVNYEILEADAINNRIQVKYSKTDKPDFFAQIGLQDGFTANDCHEAATDQVVQAERYWAKMEADTFVLDTTTGQTKDHVFVDAPSYDFATQTIEENITETETTVTHGWTVTDKTNNELALDIRKKRNDLLRLTDNWGFSDRTMTDEMIAYRQALRDIPNQNTFPSSVSWPVQPID